MPRSFEAYLWDMHEAGMDILQATQGKTLEAYLADRNLRESVERNFQIVGEAIQQCRQHHPQESLAVSDIRDIVAFRNLTTHVFDPVDGRLVWKIVQNSLPLLVAEVSVLLDEWHQG